MLPMLGLQTEEFIKHQAEYLRQFAAEQRLANSLPTTTLSARVAHVVVQVGLWLERCGRRYASWSKQRMPQRDAFIEEVQLSR